MKYIAYFKIKDELYWNEIPYDHKLLPKVLDAMELVADAAVIKSDNVISVNDLINKEVE